MFTDRRFEGNPLAVFPDARGLDDADMQRIARELNLSETSFVFPPTQPDTVAALRMFTPGYEVPFAGHPTIGTAFALRSAGLLPPGPCDFAFEERVGRVPVITLIGIVSMVFVAVGTWRILVDHAYTPNLAFADWGALIVIAAGVVIFYGMRYYRSRQGVNIDQRYREIPIE